MDGGLCHSSKTSDMCGWWRGEHWILKKKERKKERQQKKKEEKNSKDNFYMRLEHWGLIYKQCITKY